MDAFMAQSAALQGSQASWAGLTQAAGEGKLQMEPGVAEQCAKHCEDMIETLQGRIVEVNTMRTNINMGDCLIGQALQNKYTDKVVGASNSIISVISQHQQVLTEMAATYRAAGAAFHGQEQTNTAAMGG